MAKIKSGILSKVQGKVAGVVGATWKGKNYLRELVKPGNPNTPAQQLQRGKMSVAVKASRTFLAPVLSPFVGKFIKNMSAYNWFVKQNIGEAGVAGHNIKSLMLSFGTLTAPAFLASACSLSMNKMSVDGVTAPTVPTGHTVHAVIGICTPDAKTSSYAIVPATGGQEVSNLASDLDNEFEGKIFVSVFFVDASGYGTTDEKVWAISNTCCVEVTI